MKKILKKKNISLVSLRRKKLLKVWKTRRNMKKTWNMRSPTRMMSKAQRKCSLMRDLPAIWGIDKMSRLRSKEGSFIRCKRKSGSLSSCSALQEAGAILEWTQEEMGFMRRTEEQHQLSETLATSLTKWSKCNCSKRALSNLVSIGMKRLWRTIKWPRTRKTSLSLLS